MRILQGIFFVSLLNTALASVLSWKTTAETIANIEEAIACTGCESVLVFLQALAHPDNDDDFMSTITDICIGNGINDLDSCEELIAEQGPILAHDLRTMDVVPPTTAKFLCTTIFGLCDSK